MFDARLPVADEMALRNLVARYAHYADAARLDDFAALFTANASWTRENSPPPELGGSGLPSETFVGHEALKDMIQKAIVERFERKVRHQVTDVLLEPGETTDTARGVFRALITDWREGRGRIAMCATYTAAFAHDADGWRFRSLSLNVLPG